MTKKKLDVGEPAEAPTCVRRSAREWADKTTPDWALAAAETVARITGRDPAALTEDEFAALIERVR